MLKQSKRAVCDICGHLVCKLGTHQGVHDRNRPRLHLCIECGRPFTSQYALKLHGRTHTGEQPHKCSVCSKRFSQKSNLRIHMRVHTEERAFKCLVCFKMLATRQSLQNHMNIHYGLQPHVCRHCNTRYRFQARRI